MKFRPALIVMVAIFAVGCGAAGPSLSPADELLAAVEATVAEGTVRIDQTIEFRGSSMVPNGTTASASGQASFGAERQMRLEADFTDLMGLGELEMIQDGSLVYARGALFRDVGLVQGDQWVLIDLESDHPSVAPFKSLTSGQNDVSMALFYLYGVTGDVDVSDGGTVNGQETRHFAVEIDLEAARDTIPDTHAEALEDLLAGLRVSEIERQLAGEVWVGEDGLVQQVAYAFRLGPGMGEGSMSTIIVFSDFGAQMELDIPDRSEVVPIEEARP